MATPEIFIWGAKYSPGDVADKSFQWDPGAGPGWRVPKSWNSLHTVHCLQILTAKTIKIWKFPTNIHLLSHSCPVCLTVRRWLISDIMGGGLSPIIAHFWRHHWNRVSLVTTKWLWLKRRRNNVVNPWSAVASDVYISKYSVPSWAPLQIEDRWLKSRPVASVNQSQTQMTRPVATGLGMQRAPGLTYILNFWHSGALALRPERQSARMSEI